MLGLGLVLFINVMPTPGFLKNKTQDGVTISAASLSDKKRSPIIETYYEKDYDSFDEARIKKVNSKIVGNIEGEIPAVFLDKDPRIAIWFYKDKKEVFPENPKIRLKSVTSLWDRGETEVLEETEEDPKKTEEGYVYKSSFLKDKPADPTDEIEVLKIEVRYELEGKSYISVFAMNQFGEDYEEDN